MAEKVKVFLAEDDVRARGSLGIGLELGDFPVVLEAASLAEALEKAGSPLARDIRVAILDGDLGTGPDDGPTVARMLRAKVPGIKIISISGNPVDWGDANPQKPVSPKLLAQIIRDLLKEEGECTV